ncbi:hypothetical protein JIN84_19695 [Luteolibacter yonseiensis]|uniref:Uncharacterized protein n=1 Tax=Luteolibacter yonseiensis TaxID=1144680 RepID=A0A934VDS5_9BACT|nr:hypothetical protein [Luteolibacter yonseiensis]MBK1817854.1 hypothetical protein [Luteolibacter yonseiensis]
MNEPPLRPRARKAPVIVITAIITTVVVSILWIVGLTGVSHYFSRNTPTFAVKIDAPSHAEVGEVITLHVKIRNPDDVVQSLDNIGISDSLFDGFKVVGVSPDASVARQLGSGSSYTFHKKHSPGMRRWMSHSIWKRSNPAPGPATSISIPRPKPTSPLPRPSASTPPEIVPRTRKRTTRPKNHLSHT